eukprot:jgi/Botrbrau1/1904/Bobra.0005s0019.1
MAELFAGLAVPRAYHLKAHQFIFVLASGLILLLKYEILKHILFTRCTLSSSSPSSSPSELLILLLMSMDIYPTDLQIWVSDCVDVCCCYSCSSCCCCCRRTCCCCCFLVFLSFQWHIVVGLRDHGRRTRRGGLHS